ncbi:MAG: 3-keto-disaccharide hydrolase, partial [Vicinamibacteria bacterium]
ANEKPVGEWIEYEITVDGGKVSLKVNGEVLNDGTGGEEVAGKICLQSEGAVIQFRNIRIKELKK